MPFGLAIARSDWHMALLACGELAGSNGMGAWNPNSGWIRQDHRPRTCQNESMFAIALWLGVFARPLTTNNPSFPVNGDTLLLEGWLKEKRGSHVVFSCANLLSRGGEKSNLPQWDRREQLAGTRGTPGNAINRALAGNLKLNLFKIRAGTMKKLPVRKYFSFPGTFTPDFGSKLHSDNSGTLCLPLVLHTTGRQFGHVSNANSMYGLTSKRPQRVNPGYWYYTVYSVGSAAAITTIVAILEY
eukprot:1471201-Rhodomonas_salina.3